MSDSIMCDEHLFYDERIPKSCFLYEYDYIEFNIDSIHRNVGNFVNFIHDNHNSIDMEDIYFLVKNWNSGSYMSYIGALNVLIDKDIHKAVEMIKKLGDIENIKQYHTKELSLFSLHQKDYIVSSFFTMTVSLPISRQIELNMYKKFQFIYYELERYFKTHKLFNDVLLEVMDYIKRYMIIGVDERPEICKLVMTQISKHSKKINGTWHRNIEKAIDAYLEADLPIETLDTLSIFIGDVVSYHNFLNINNSNLSYLLDKGYLTKHYNRGLLYYLYRKTKYILDNYKVDSTTVRNCLTPFIGHFGFKSFRDVVNLVDMINANIDSHDVVCVKKVTYIWQQSSK